MSIQDATAALRRVYVRAPDAADAGAWNDYAWRSAPDPARAADEHEAFRAALVEFGAEVVLADTAVPGDIDAIYTYDPALLTDAGAILLRTGKPGRRAEPDAMGIDLEAAGIPCLARLEAPATAEGGDMFWLDERTLVVGRGYRTNDEGIGQLRSLLEPLGAEVASFDLPHFRGRDACLHLMSFISPLAPDLAVVYPSMVPVRLMEMLRQRDIDLVEVPDEEFDPQGPNVLALGPREALALDGNPATRRAMESAGVQVRVFSGEEICRKGDGGPTCLTRPLERA